MSNATQQLKAQQRRQKFADLLREMFQLNQPELDFGLYRIMHARKDDINRFIEQDLPRITQEAFSQYASQDQAQLEAELEEHIKSAKGLGMDPDAIPKVQELKQQLQSGFDLAREEGEVYDALVTLFNRYYNEGDFLSRRVYKDGTYAIPYQGEEVVLHWANKDQYYIKSSESLRDYSFRLNPDAGPGEDPMRVHFKLVDAEEGAKDNNKESAESRRVFVLDEENPFELIEGEATEHGEKYTELQCRFVFRPAVENDWTEAEKKKATTAAQKKPPTQDVLRAIAEERLLVAGSDLPEPWKGALIKPYRKADGSRADYSMLAGQLNNYTKKNTFDYFIHKDLGGFLTRELDFYIKNELLDWNDIASLKNDTSRLAPLLSKIEVVRSLGEKIIEFLSQLESFQKKLWKKKKFVTEANYCISLDRLASSPELASYILNNEDQLSEWQHFFGVDAETLRYDLTNKSWEEFVNAPRYRFLMIDTRYFDRDFKNYLLSKIDDIDSSITGLAVNSENYQALNFLGNKFGGAVNGVYIDPPYNTGGDGFPYKDGYRHSSWMAMMLDRVRLSKEFIRNDGALFVSIDERESSKLKLMLDNLFGESNHLASFSWVTDGNSDNQAKVKILHEEIHAFCVDEPSFAHPPVIDPSVDKSSKIFRDKIKNTIVKNGPKNPVSEVEIPMGFPCSIKAGEIDVSNINWPKYKKNIKVKDFKTIESLVAESGWSSKKQLLDFINNDMSPVYDSKGQEVCFEISSTGAIESVKKRAEVGSYVTSVIRGVGTIQSNSAMLGNMGVPYDFYPKPTGLVEYISSMMGSDDNLVLDYFAGSGTTGHAILNLNRSQGKRNRFILVEMGDQFHSVVIPRLKKASYAESWKSGKPVGIVDEDAVGISCILKYISLESYEDSISNLAFNTAKKQNSLLNEEGANIGSDTAQAYFLNYMLEVETRGSQSLLNVKSFVDPTQYKLDVKSINGSQTKAINVDLLETFNYLLGLEVEHIAAPIHFEADLNQAEYGRWQAKVKRSKTGKWWFRTVYGANRAGQQVLVVWRNLPSVIDGEADGIQKDNAVLDSVLIEKLSIRMTESQDDEIDVLYVNGDHNISIPRSRKGEPMEQARIQLIEEAFHRLMFADTEAVH